MMGEWDARFSKLPSRMVIEFYDPWGNYVVTFIAKHRPPKRIGEPKVWNVTAEVWR